MNTTISANARKTHCPRGHAYSVENTKYDKNTNGSISRKCKSCISIRLKKRYISSTRARIIKNPNSEYREKNIKHGEYGTRIYVIWSKMIGRCSNLSDALYGGRGISVCDEWRDYRKFAEWARSNGYNDKLTIDRINNDGNYEPSNCRWTTPKQQANNRRSNRLIEYKGIVMTLQQWAEKTNIKRETIAYRINHGWDIQQALTVRTN